MSQTTSVNVVTVDIFTDGSYTKNHPSVCGIGVHFPSGEYPDLSEPFVHEPSNQRAELMAIMRAIIVVRGHDDKRPIVIHTDSKYAIGCCTDWLHRWQQNDEWKTSNGHPVQNQDILRPLSAQLHNVTFVHVKAHTRKRDPESVGNNKADQLAKQAIVDFVTKK